ncbi:MAG: hypothetical protein GX100_01250 [candidate division WS1 bacterium]|nr:hypothetical protein [candidate division WS1 bacterium]
MTNASPPTLVFTGPGLALAGAVPLVADLRSVELSPHPLLAPLRERTGQVAQEALRLARALAPALPEEVRERPGAEIPSLWECAEHEFARYSLAPALLNQEIAGSALAATSGAVLLRERPRGAWWLGGSGAEEAVTEAARREGSPLTLAPSPTWRSLRRHLLPCVARRTPRALSECDSCPVLQSERPGPPCDLLFLSVAATVAPIVERLAPALAAADLSCAVLDYHCSGSTRALRRTSLRVVDGRPQLHAGTPAFRWARSRFSAWRRETHANLRHLTVAGSLPAWLAPVVARRLAVTFARDLPVLAAYRQAAQVLLDALQPRVVVGLHLLPDVVAPLLFSAQARGLRTAWHQHGIRGPVHRNGVVFPWQEFLAWGPYTSDLYADLLPPHSHWTFTGNGLYDDLLAQAPPDPTPLRARLGLGARPVLLVATQSDEPHVQAQQPRWWLRGVAEAARSLGALVLLKLHPIGDHPATYQELVTSFPDTVRLFRHEELSLREGLVVADAVVIRDSTVAFEAALLGKPVVTVTLEPALPRFPLAEHGGALAVTRYEDLEPALGELLSGGPTLSRLAETRAAFLEYHLGPQDGGATHRLVAALSALAAK